MLCWPNLPESSADIDILYKNIFCLRILKALYEDALFYL